MNKSILTLLYVIVSILCLVVTILSLAYVGFRIYDHNYGEFAEEIENFRIDELSEYEILNKELASGTSTSNRYTSGTSTGAPNASKYEDSDNVEYSCKKFIGIASIHATKAENTVLTLNIESELLSGVGKLVVICDDEILEYIDFNETRTLVYEVRGEHIYSVKMMCEDAQVRVKISRTFEPLP